jgi:small subunit ribosomal protein S7
MSRRHAAAKREILPDPKYGDRTLAKFINMVMSRGKKAVAEKIVYGALGEVEQRGKGGNAIDIFKQALENVEPKVEVKSRRVGGATYQVPVEVRPNRRSALAMRWLVDAARKRNEKSMGQRLANEMLEAFDNRGTAVKKREDTHKMAEANRAFSHYRW